MTRKEAERLTRQRDTLVSLGFTHEEADQLRRISMTLHRWHELECGDSNNSCSWSIERDEATGKPYRVVYPHNSNKQIRYPVADRETGAKKRLLKIINEHASRTDRALSAYIQTDPRGAALYIIRPGDVPQGADVSAYYSRGVCVY